MSEQKCARCSGSGEILIGGALNARYIDCSQCDGEGVIEQFDKVDGITRDTSYSPFPQRETHKF